MTLLIELVRKRGTVWHIAAPVCGCSEAEKLSGDTSVRRTHMLFDAPSTEQYDEVHLAAPEVPEVSYPYSDICRFCTRRLLQETVPAENEMHAARFSDPATANAGCGP